MLSLFKSSKTIPRSRRASCAGFTLVDVCGGMTILSLVAGSVVYGLTQLNHFAAVNRLYTAAQTLAQNQIDLILTMGPYDPNDLNGDKYPVPANCGTASSTNTILRTDQEYYYDSAATGTCPMSLNEKKVTLYRDPMAPAENATVQATIKTKITDTGMTVDVGGVPTSLDLRRATVTVGYKYRNRDYAVVMETMRTSDQ